ncbi:MAG: carboxypeptidase-like regulatory domain-containing protein [Phycisphaerae bacterium]|nr:carboxypeptidase-like regulatory domain-containing protein [Phycisphaerae bacterium]
MIGRLILKSIAAVTFVSIGIVVLAVIVVIGYFFVALAFPNRMSVIGRVTDSGGRPIKGVEVRAVPLPIHDAYSEAGTMEAQGKEHTAFTDDDGCFRLKRIIASGGVKEGMWLQEYNIMVTAEGYRPQIIRVRNDYDRHKDVIMPGDFVLEEKDAAEKEGSKLVGLFGEASQTKK